MDEETTVTETTVTETTATWSAQKITADAANELQIGAGIIVTGFDVASPVEPDDADIICNTTGDFTISSTHEDSDLFEDVNNAPTGTMEGRRIDSWTHTLSVTAVSVTLNVIKTALGAADAIGATGVRPRKQYVRADFKDICWIGDMMEENKILVAVMKNSVSTGGLTLTATNKGKGNIGLEFQAHPSIANPDVEPAEYYILTKTVATNTTQGQ